MPANTLPLYPLVPNNGHAFVTDANPNYDGTGFLVPTITGGANGSFLDTLTLKAQANCDPTKVNVFFYNGATWAFIDDIPLPAVTVSTTQKNGALVDVLEAIGYGGGFALKAGEKIGLSVTVAANYRAFWTGGDY